MAKSNDEQVLTQLLDNLKLNHVEKPKKINNETYGMSFEYAICKYYNISNNIKINRIDEEIVQDFIRYIIIFNNKDEHFKFSNIKEYIGNKNTSVDFITKDDLSVSIKTNSNGSKVCPQKIGQCTKKKWCEYFIKDQELKDIDDSFIKYYIVENIDTIIQEYYNNLFCCDILAYWNKKNKSKIDIYYKQNIPIINFVKSDYTFTHILKNKEWNESTTLKVNKLTLGEFQIHNNRDCIKFRFDFRNLYKLIFLTTK